MFGSGSLPTKQWGLPDVLAVQKPENPLYLNPLHRALPTPCYFSLSLSKGGRGKRGEGERVWSGEAHLKHGLLTVLDGGGGVALVKPGVARQLVDGDALVGRNAHHPLQQLVHLCRGERGKRGGVGTGGLGVVCVMEEERRGGERRG